MSARRVLAIAALLAAPLLAACGSSGDDSAAVSTDGPAATVATTEAASTGGGGIIGGLTAGVEMIDDSQSTACDVIRTTLETAIEAYFVMNGSFPATLDDLVGTLIAEPAPQFEISADGAIQPVAAGPCVGH